MHLLDVAERNIAASFLESYPTKKLEMSNSYFCSVGKLNEWLTLSTIFWRKVYVLPDGVGFAGC